MMRRRLPQLAVLLFASLLTMGATDAAGRFSSIGHKLVCVCGCTQILLECNHVGCPDSPKQIAELQSKIASGDGDTSIFNWFAAKYGPTVLATPMRGGFDNVAWIVPVSLFLLATLGTVFIVHRWNRRTQPAIAGMPSAPQASSDELRDRIRRETEY
jgi:cytochrome c-type biogenesis protein CcmH